MKNELLSPRQKEVVALMAKGYTKPEIAEHLGLSLHTIKTHVENAARKIKGPRKPRARLLAYWNARSK